MCYSEHYVEGTAQKVDSIFLEWMECFRLNIMWNNLHRSGQCYGGFNVICYSEHYVEDTAQQVDSGIAAWVEYVIVNIMLKVLHRISTVFFFWMDCFTVIIMWKLLHSK